MNKEASAINAIAKHYRAAADLLQGRVITVTGAGDGIGRTAATTFAAHGATVVLLGRTLEKLEAVYDTIESAGHPKPAIFLVDFASATADDYAALAGAIDDEFGMLHGLLHNASLLGERKPLAQADIATWQQVMHVNVTSQLMLTQALLPVMEAAPRASIVFTSSGVGRVGRAYWGAYGVSKFATEGLMQTLADELENTSNIRVNSLNPGATRTGMRAAAYPAEDPATLLKPDDIMASYLYLMGDDSAGVNGEALSAQ
jgi:NAD(P)-dependent dehydrogenase (short-subunit alcohol dehydrogenase family)